MMDDVNCHHFSAGNCSHPDVEHPGQFHFFAARCILFEQRDPRINKCALRYPYLSDEHILEKDDDR
jgi:hypothetical protein